MKDWIIKKLGGTTQAGVDKLNQRHKSMLQQERVDAEKARAEYGKAASGIIQAGKMVRVEPNQRDFIVQFSVCENFVHQAFLAGNDSNAIRYFTDSVGDEVFRAIRSLNFTRPAEYRR